MADLNEWRLEADLAVLTQSYRDVEPLLPESSMEADGEGFAIGGSNACVSLALFRSNKACYLFPLPLLVGDMEGLPMDLRPY